MRLVPPKPRELAADPGVDAEAAAWARGLHHKRRSLAIAVIGNALLLGVLLGVPFVRGQTRARATVARQARFTGCLLGRKVREPVGIGAPRDEAERFAERLLREGPGFAKACQAALDAVPADDAFFVLPSVKSAEQRVREAVRVMRKELAAVAPHQPGEPVSDRPLRALAQLRDMVRAQGEAASLLDLPVHTSVAEASTLPRPSVAFLYAARDATLTLWGDDQALYATAFDKTGVSYLEALAGRPMRRARLVRPTALRGVYRGTTRSLLVWATPEARCKERAQGCYGKTSSIAPLSLPLFTLPTARLLAAHVVGRIDRSLALTGDSLALAVANDAHGVSLATLPLPAQTLFDAELPPLTVEQQPESYRDLLLLTGSTRRFVLATSSAEGQGTLASIDTEGAHPLASFAGGEAPWVVACTRGDVIDFAAGSAHELRIGRLHDGVTELWEPVTLNTAEVVHPSDPERDAVRLSCADERAFALVRDAEHTLTALACRNGTPRCETKQLGRGVSAFTMLATPGHVLVAQAGDVDHPQILVSAIGLDLSGSPARSPAACWVDSRGLCGPPHLARLGNRIVLAGHEGTDLSLLESADDGQSWTPPPVY
jgi:hypothetical protein